MANLSQIEEFLKSKQIPHQIVNLGSEVFTVDQVKKTGVKEDEIVKTLIIKTNNDFIVLAVRGCDRVDFKKVRRLFGPSTSLRPSALRSSTMSSDESLRLEEVNCELAKPEEVQKIVGVPIGAVCPVLIEVPLYFDRKVMSLKHVNMGSGDLTHGLEMDFSDLLKAVGEYKVEDLVLDESDVL